MKKENVKLLLLIVITLSSQVAVALQVMSPVFAQSHKHWVELRGQTIMWFRNWFELILQNHSLIFIRLQAFLWANSVWWLRVGEASLQNSQTGTTSTASWAVRLSVFLSVRNVISETSHFNRVKQERQQMRHLIKQADSAAYTTKKHRRLIMQYFKTIKFSC